MYQSRCSHGDERNRSQPLHVCVIDLWCVSWSPTILHITEQYSDRETISAGQMHGLLPKIDLSIRRL